LIGRQYIEQHKEIGRPVGSKFNRKLPQTEEITGLKIAKQSNTGHATVERASVFFSKSRKMKESAILRLFSFSAM